MIFTADREEFADKQSKVQAKDEKYLLGSARAALRRHARGDADWYKALLKRVEQVARTAYRREADHVSSDTLRAALNRMRAELEESLPKTKKPEKGQLAHRAQALAASLAAFANAVGVEAAADVDEREIGLEWVTMHDDRVRDAHRAADGQVQLPGEKYDVGGVKMSRPGDVTAPIELWINCRCALRPAPYVKPEAVVAAASQYEKQGIGIFLLPAEGDPILDLSTENPPHVTVAFMGLTSEQQVDVEALKEAVAMASSDFAPVDVQVKGRDVLGNDNADVAFLNRDQMVALRDSLVQNDVVAEAMANVEQYPEWLPHLTLGYPETPANEGELPSTIRLDRLALFVGKDHYEYPLGGDMPAGTDPVEEVDPAAEADAELADMGQIDGAEPVPFYGVLAPENVMSGDSRKFAPDSMRWRDLPLPLMWQPSNEPGHDGAVMVGRIDNIWRDEAGLLQADGEFLISEEADKVVAMMAQRALRGVSVDVDDATMSFEDQDGNELTMDSVLSEDTQVVSVITSGRICAATMCAIPAFMEAQLFLGTRPVDAPADAPADPVAAAGDDVETFVKTEDGPGWVTHPVDTERLRRYWTKGKGAAKIGWGTPGDFNRCRAELAKYVKPQHLAGYCANRHYDALGFWPGRPVAAETLDFSQGESFHLVASGSPDVPPREWFENPNLTAPTRLTITEDGHIFGHLATWGVCHIGISNVCTEAPSSLADYAYFATGVVTTTDGDVRVGQITMSCGHAGPDASSRAAAAHYDNLGTAAADIAIGEDEIGIWFSGAIRPNVTPEQVAALRAAGSVSGDWRTIGDGLELVAALAVNVPGFPIPVTQIAASGGRQTALVAAGIVVEKSRETLSEIVSREVAMHLAMHAAQREMADLAARKAAQDMAALAALRGK